MRGILDQYDPAPAPLVEVDPFHSRANDLVVTLERGQLRLYPTAERYEAVAQPLETPL